MRAQPTQSRRHPVLVLNNHLCTLDFETLYDML